MYRTLLFAPAARPELLRKAQLSDADAVIFDLEDSVPSNAKDQARANILEAFAQQLTKPVFVRINGAATADFTNDLTALSTARSLENVKGVILPKAETSAEIKSLAQHLANVEQKVKLAPDSLSIVPLIETCLGLRHAYEMASTSSRVRGVALASAEQGDFMVDLGGRWTPNGHALLYPRSKLVVDARAAGVSWVIDGVFMNMGANDLLRQECEIARELGYVGKMAIHPTQLPVIHEVFSPSPEEVEFARGLIKAFREAESRGLGAVRYQGMMVDYANLKLAQRTLALAGVDAC